MPLPADADSCIMPRRWTVRRSTLNMLTGETTEPGPPEWEEGACGAPLFSEAERDTGVCKSCLGGWTHPENYPVASGPPLEAAAALREDAAAFEAEGGLAVDQAAECLRMADRCEFYHFSAMGRAVEDLAAEPDCGADWLAGKPGRVYPGGLYIEREPDGSYSLTLEDSSYAAPPLKLAELEWHLFEFSKLDG